MALRVQTRTPASTAHKSISSKVHTGGVPSRRSGPVRAEGRDEFRATGFVAEDNSGKSNIFPTKQQAYINSSTADAAARQGLGGLQGGLLVGFTIGAVALVTFLGLKAPGPETLQSVQVSTAAESDSLSAIAQRIQQSL